MNVMKQQTMLVAAVCAVALLAGGFAPLALAADELNEADLIAVLKSDGDWEKKQEACRGLRRVGTVKAIPALAALLPDAKLSHMARYALEPMSMAEAGQTLRDALGTTEGLPKMGVVISLGARQDAKAVPLLIPLLADADQGLAKAAAGALGRIATQESIEALQGVAPGSDALSVCAAEGLLTAAEILVDGGKGKKAAAIHEALLGTDYPMHIRTGAFYGMAYAQPNDSPKRLIAALGGDEPLFRDMAAQIVAETSGASTTKQYADALQGLPADGQAALLRGLATRGDVAARPVAASATQSSDGTVQLAAVKALGGLGNASDARALSAFLASDVPEMSEAARVSLSIMQDDALDGAIAGIVPGASPAVRAQLLDILAIRRADQAIPLATAGLTDAAAPVRLAAMRVFGLVGTAAETSLVVNAAVGTEDETERGGAESALSAISSRYGADALPAILEGMPGAGREAKGALLRTAAQIGGGTALEAVHAALDDADEETGREALRLLSNWPTMDAAPQLKELAKSEDLSRQVLGLRGFVRLASADRDGNRKAGMLTEAMALAKRPDERKLVLAAWGTLPTVRALDALQPHLEDAAIQDEAATALVSVAAAVGKKDENKVRAVKALKAVLANSENEGIRTNAQNALEALKK